MVLKLRFDPQATKDLKAIRVYLLAEAGPASADRVRSHLRERMERLRLTPRMGVKTSAPGIRCTTPIASIIRLRRMRWSSCISGTAPGAIQTLAICCLSCIYELQRARCRVARARGDQSGGAGARAERDRQLCEPDRARGQTSARVHAQAAFSHQEQGAGCRIVGNDAFARSVPGVKKRFKSRKRRLW